MPGGIRVRTSSWCQLSGDGRVECRGVGYLGSVMMRCVVRCFDALPSWESFQMRWLARSAMYVTPRQKKNKMEQTKDLAYILRR